MSVLRPESLALLAQGPTSSALLREPPDNVRGPYKILAQVGGGFVVFDPRAPNARGVVGEPHALLEQARTALRGLPLEGDEP